MYVCEYALSIAIHILFFNSPLGTPNLVPFRKIPIASLTINIYFTYFCIYCITRITINNGTPHLKSLKSQKLRAAFGRPAIKLLGVSTSLRSTNPRP